MLGFVFTTTSLFRNSSAKPTGSNILLAVPAVDSKAETAVASKAETAVASKAETAVASMVDFVTTAPFILA